VTPEETLNQIVAEVNACTSCELHFSRKLGVPGEGPANADVIFIGEGPGFHENEQGRPFVGAAGRFFEELLEQNGMKREEVYITNVVKCRPPGNRDPLAEEISACDSYLERQIAVINPKVVVTLGRFSMTKFCPNGKIGESHGVAIHSKGRLVIPMYHPAAALHQPSLRPVLEKDFAQLPEIIDNSDAAPVFVEKAFEEKPDPKQLSMF